MTRHLPPRRDGGMRSAVVDSWHRSASAGVRPDDATAPITLPEDALRDQREAHPLARVFPLLDDVLGHAARDCGAVMAVSDADGQLLWVCGTPTTLRRAEAIGFVEGSNWDERLAGTNAPGLALALDQPVSIVRDEHFRSAVQGWSCGAAPIHDPGTHALLGVLDITGGDQIVVPQTMAMIRAAARMAELELARDLLTRQAPAPASTAPGAHLVLEGLGRTDALLTVEGAGGAPRTVRLSPRHSEILLLLASAPQGLSGDELAVLLYADDGSGGSGSSTLRAELNRLRHLLGGDLLASRPYRLTAQVTGDWLTVEALLATGDLRAAMRAYGGPVLPRSTAPGVTRLRENLGSQLRGALLRSREADLMSQWTRSTWGADDYEMWQAQRRAVGATSPMLPLIDGQLARLDRELGV
ncbi:transcriptional regulator [Nocardioides sp. ChNu-153]|uniref:helix-turn-helix domain-containing protein n=1 Tax=unclassified Nocardioides TaxID=2615069 RepID=UPI002405795A|nr:MULTISPECIES: helix-turn-helix domain-containing protein [unclassified Nocardioides]MDF9717368.1 transcriptional regulator [Nocardioides sp. ChNu-99]MDN7122411.1 transcriptional regulator [Nocardioides sp. ChNu-153]